MISVSIKKKCLRRMKKDFSTFKRDERDEGNREKIHV